MNLSIARVIIFCFSAFLAGISGATYASLFGSVTSDSFFYAQSLVVLAVMAISGRRSITASIVAPILLYVVPSYTSNPDLKLGLQVAFGVAAVLVAVTSQSSFSFRSSRSPHVVDGRRLDPISASVRRQIAAT